MKSRVKKINSEELPRLIHQALLDPLINNHKIVEKSLEAIHFKFGGLCTFPTNLSLVREHLGKNKDTKLISVIGFPFGAIPTTQKRTEAEWAAEHGAEELEVVPNFNSLLNGNLNFFSEELEAICSIGIPVRVILNLGKLKQKELELAIEASLDCGVISLQNNNGFGPQSTNEEIQILSKFIRGRCSIKVVGGIHSLVQVENLMEAGAHHLGTSSGPELIRELRKIEK